MRWVLRIALTLLVLVVVAVAALFLIPTDRIARLAEAKFEENTGRALTLNGEVRPQLFPRLGITLSDVEIANAPWAGQDPMVEASRLEVGVGLSALFSGDIIVEALTIEDPTIRLKRDKDGLANWDFLGSDTAETESTGGLTEFSLPKGTILNGSITYVDDATGAKYDLRDVNAAVSLTDIRGAAEVDLTALLQGQEIAVNGTLNGLQQLLDGGVQEVDLNAQISGNAVQFNGVAGLEPLQANGALSADFSNLAGLMKIIEQPLPVIPVGMGQHPKVQADFTMSPEGDLYLRNAVIDLDFNQLRGDVDVTIGGVPYVKARLTGQSLDFSAMSTDTTQGDGAANAGAGGWSDARLDVSGLSAVNGEFSFQAQSVDLGSIKLGGTSIKGTLDRSRLVLNMGQVGAFGGAVSGQFVVNNRNGLSVGGDLNASGVSMQSVLTDFSGFDRLVGDAAMSLKFLGVGESMNQIMSSLSGSGSMQVGRGELVGLDIAGMLRNLDLAYVGEGAKTIFETISASYTIENGVLNNSDLTFQSNLLTASGRGAMDLGGQTINYRVEPVALADQLDRGIRVPFLVEGPWSNVKFRPDLKSLIDQNLEKEKAKLKAKAKAEEDRLKARAEAKLRSELGLQTDGEKDVEDAIKDALEQKAKDGLRKLFGRD